MKMGQALALLEGLLEVGKMKLPVKKAYSVVKLVEQLGTERRHFEELRRPLFEKYGEEPEKTRIAEQWRGAFLKEIEDLLSLEVELAIEPFLSIEDFGEQSIASESLAKIGPVMTESLG